MKYTILVEHEGAKFGKYTEINITKNGVVSGEELDELYDLFTASIYSALSIAMFGNTYPQNPEDIIRLGEAWNNRGKVDTMGIAPN